MVYLVVFALMLTICVLLAVIAWRADRLRHSKMPGLGELYFWRAHNSKIIASQDHQFWHLVGPLEDQDEPPV
jgi:hypothetical protein